MQRKYHSDTLETTTGALRSIDNDHAYIHEGKLFSATHKVTLTAGSSIYISFTTPNTDKVVHYRPASLTTSADNVTTLFFEGGTFTGGSTLATVNRNRKSLTTAEVLINTGVTSTLDGTLLYTSFLGGGVGVGQSRGGGELAENQEWVLKKNTVYLIKLTNGSSSSNTLCLGVRWYEEDA